MGISSAKYWINLRNPIIGTALALRHLVYLYSGCQGRDVLKGVCFIERAMIQQGQTICRP